MSSPLFAERHLKSMIKSAKEGGRVHFAFGMDGSENGHLVLDDKLESSALLGKLKAEHKLTAHAHGRFAVEQTKFLLFPVKTMRDLKKRVRSCADAQGLSCSGVEVNEDSLEADRSPEMRKTVQTVCEAILAVLKDGSMNIRVPSEYEEAIRGLWFATGATHLSGEEQWEYFEKSVKALAPVLSLDGWDSAFATWIETYILPALRKARAKVEKARAAAKIEAEMAAETDPKREMERERIKLAAQLKKVGTDTEQVLAQLGVNIAKLPSAEQRAAMNARPAGCEFGLASIDVVSQAVKVGNALLALSDEELQAKLAKIGSAHPLLKDVRTVADLSKAVSDLTSGMVAVASKSAILVAQYRGDLEMAKKLESVVDVVGKPLAGVGAAISCVQAYCVFMDEKSTPQEKLDATVNVAGAVATFVEVGAYYAGATAVGTAAAVAGAGLAAGYAAAKMYAEAYWKTRSAIMGTYANEAFKSLDKAAALIQKEVSRGAAICRLLSRDPSDGEITALSEALATSHKSLSAFIDGLLSSCTDGSYWKGAAYPGSYTVFEEKFAPLQKLKGETRPARLVENAGEVLRAVAWCFAHATKVVKAATVGAGVEAVDALIKAEEEAANG